MKEYLHKKIDVPSIWYCIYLMINNSDTSCTEATISGQSISHPSSDDIDFFNLHKHGGISENGRICLSIQLKVLDPYSMNQLVTVQEAVDYEHFFCLCVTAKHV